MPIPPTQEVAIRQNSNPRGIEYGRARRGKTRNRLEKGVGKGEFSPVHQERQHSEEAAAEPGADDDEVAFLDREPDDPRGEEEREAANGRGN